MIFGAYDGAVHFVNADTGKASRTKFQTGDIMGLFWIQMATRCCTLVRETIIYEFGPFRERMTQGCCGNVPHAKNPGEDKARPRLSNDDWDNPQYRERRSVGGGENSRVYGFQLNRRYETMSCRFSGSVVGSTRLDKASHSAD